MAVHATVWRDILTVLRPSDFFMSSLAVSDAGVAARQFASQYYCLGLRWRWLWGAARYRSSRGSTVVRNTKANHSITQALWLAVVISAPLVIVSTLYP
jgi:hypothetical protein